MSGRRAHPRFIASPALEGALRVMRDVLVERADASEFIVVSREPLAIQQILTCEISEIAAPIEVSARVVESKPFMVDGGVRHRLRLRRVGPDGPAGADGPSHTPE